MDSRIIALLSVLVVVGASYACVCNIPDDEEEDESPIAIAAFLAGLAIGYVVGRYLDSDDVNVQPFQRLNAANDITNMLKVTSTFTANSHANYAQLWSMTKEHWIRQAELEAYAEWRPGKVFDPVQVLEGSRILLNSATMTANAVAQVDSMLSEISEIVAEWKDTNCFGGGKMSIGYIAGGTEWTSSDYGWDGKLISVVDARNASGTVYIAEIGEDYIPGLAVSGSDYAPGYVYSFGKSSTVRNVETGLSYTLHEGMNDLASIPGFESGVYTVTDTVIGGDCLARTDLDVRSGFVMTVDGRTKVLYNDGGSLILDGLSVDSLLLKVIPKDIPSGEKRPDDVDLGRVLANYQTLLDRIYWTSVNASNSAEAVWSIYDEVNERDHNITTLMNDNVYETAVLSKGMNQVLALSAMQQLASYYDSHGDDLERMEIGLYSEGMDTVFVRGSILDKYGTVLYDDVIYTPFFQTDSVRMSVGIDHQLKQNCLVAMWADGRELSAWSDSGMDTSDYCTVFVDDGCTFTVNQIAMCDSGGMHNVTSADFTVTKVNYISPGKVDPEKTSDVNNSGRNLLQIACVVIGILLVLYGLYSRRPVTVLIGIGLIAFGILFADTVWRKLTELGKWGDLL